MGDRSPTTRGRDDFPNAGFKNSKTYAVENIVLFSAIKTELTRQENSVKLPQSARNTGEQELGNKEGQNKGGHSALFGEDNGGHISLFTPKSAMSPFLKALFPLFRRPHYKHGRMGHSLQARLVPVRARLNALTPESNEKPQLRY
jgi:hypothetical protein